MARFSVRRLGRWQFRLRTLLLGMLLAGPLALAGKETLHEFELRQARAQRVQCAGGLKQLGIALHYYHDLVGVGRSVGPAEIVSDLDLVP